MTRTIATSQIGVASTIATLPTTRSNVRLMTAWRPVRRAGRTARASVSPMGCTDRREARISVMLADTISSTSWSRRTFVRFFMTTGSTPEEATKTHSMPSASMIDGS